MNAAIHVFLIWLLWKQTLRLRVACRSFVEKRDLFRREAEEGEIAVLQQETWQVLLIANYQS